MHKYTVHTYKDVNFKDIHKILNDEVIEGEGTDEDIQRQARQLSSRGYKILAWVVKEEKEDKRV